MPATTEVNRFQARRGPATLVVAGGLAAQFKDGDVTAVEIWDLRTKRVIATVPTVSERALAVHGDAIHVLVNDRAKDQARLVTYTGAKPTTTTGKAIVANPQCFAVAGASAFVGERGGLSKLSLPAFELAGFVPWKRDEVDTCTSFRDGVAYVEGGAIVTVDAAMKRTAYTHDLAGIIHLAPASSDRVWATTGDGVHLVQLAGGKATPGPAVVSGNVYAIAAAGTRVAVLTVDMTAGRWSKLTLSTVGADGKLAWTKELPVPDRVHVDIAADATYVVVNTSAARHVFAAADGAQP